MALSDVQIEQGQKYLKAWQKCTSRPMAAHHLSFAQAIEAEARRDALEEAEKKCELVAQRWSHHMVAPSAALGCAAAIRELKEDTQ